MPQRKIFKIHKVKENRILFASSILWILYSIINNDILLNHDYSLNNDLKKMLKNKCWLISREIGLI